MRDDHGFCVRCATERVGITRSVGYARTCGTGHGGHFDGYTSQQETEKKILRNVFAGGDAWFATGDLMRKDEQGYFYFVDRVGDTFRWKGENVATSEVAEAIGALPQVAEANVYGVAIPGTDGRAGMAAMVLKGRLDLALFAVIWRNAARLRSPRVRAHPARHRSHRYFQARKKHSRRKATIRASSRIHFISTIRRGRLRAARTVFRRYTAWRHPYQRGRTNCGV